MKVLIACEESQRVCIEFRRLGHEAYSCDIEPCSGGHPEWHIQDDVLRILKPTYDGEAWLIDFSTMDDEIHVIEKWDMILAFPPCTYLTNTGNRWFNVERYGDRAVLRHLQREKAIEFFLRIANTDCERIAIENPVGVMSSRYQKPDQIIQPYEFGEPERKTTCLWLKGLPKLQPTKIVEPKIVKCAPGAIECNWHMETLPLKPKERSKLRSKTFIGIAKAMAEQWGRLREGEEHHDPVQFYFEIGGGGMTENEAIKELKDENEQCYEQCEGFCSEVINNVCTCRDATILSALEQYRAIGTVEECREAMRRQRR